MITLKQLAELSGLSVRTVGRALSGHPYVSPDKRALVLALAQKYRYTPNMAARNLRLQRKNFVGILFDNYELSSDSRLLNMLNRRLAANGFWPLLGCVAERETFDRMLHEWAGVAEYVIVLHELDTAALEHLFELSAHLPLKFIYADCLRSSGDHAFAVDRVASVRNLVRELSGMGFRHLLYCGSLPSRSDGVKLARRDGLPIRISSIASPIEFEDGVRLGDRITASGADVVFFDTDRMAMGFYRYAAEHHVAIPGDIAAVGFDDEQFVGFLTPPLASLAHPRQQIIDRIMDILRTGDPPPREPLLMELVRRESLELPAHP